MPNLRRIFNRRAPTLVLEGEPDIEQLAGVVTDLMTLIEEIVDEIENPAPERITEVVTTTSTLETGQEDLLVDNAAVLVTITMPGAQGAQGRRYNIKRLGTANVTVAGAGGALIDTDDTFVLVNQFDNIRLTSDGTDWWIL